MAVNERASRGSSRLLKRPPTKCSMAESERASTSRLAVVGPRMSSAMPPIKLLMAWKERVGSATARRIGAAAKLRGTVAGGRWSTSSDVAHAVRTSSRAVYKSCKQRQGLYVLPLEIAGRRAGLASSKSIRVVADENLEKQVSLRMQERTYVAAYITHGTERARLGEPSIINRESRPSCDSHFATSCDSQDVYASTRVSPGSPMCVDQQQVYPGILERLVRVVSWERTTRGAGQS